MTRPTDTATEAAPPAALDLGALPPGVPATGDERPIFPSKDEQAIGALVDLLCPDDDSDETVHADLVAMGVDVEASRARFAATLGRLEGQAVARVQAEALDLGALSEDDERDVQTALAAADAGNAGHWPTVAGVLADEVRRVRARRPEREAGPLDLDADDRALAARQATLPEGGGPTMPCPFCDTKPAKLRVIGTLREGCADGEPDAHAYAVHCGCCATEGPWRKSKTGAVREWDRRPGPATVLDLGPLERKYADTAATFDEVYSADEVRDDLYPTLAALRASQQAAADARQHAAAFAEDVRVLRAERDAARAQVERFSGMYAAAMALARDAAERTTAERDRADRAAALLAAYREMAENMDPRGDDAEDTAAYFAALDRVQALERAALPATTTPPVEPRADAGRPAGAQRCGFPGVPTAPARTTAPPDDLAALDVFGLAGTPRPAQPDRTAPPTLAERAARHGLVRDDGGWKRTGQDLHIVWNEDEWAWSPETWTIAAAWFATEDLALSAALAWLDAGCPSGVGR